MHLFYTPDIEGNSYILSEEESKHATKVLRLGKGAEVYLTDGKGRLMKSEITQAHTKKCMIDVKSTIDGYNTRSYELEIAVAPTKNNSRLEWFLEKATEIGIDTICPILCKYSERKVIKTNRLEKVITSAMKQSLKAWHPKLNDIVDFDDYISKDFDGLKFIAYCEADKENRIETHLGKGEKSSICIGPEGGFSLYEIEMAKERGFIPISLSLSRLRTETAAVVACHSVAFINKN
jgi:16S rRNA (uracil1498-N3)-methyltransferase